jgi:hypothetical protein
MPQFTYPWKKEGEQQEETYHRIEVKIKFINTQVLRKKFSMCYVLPKRAVIIAQFAMEGEF